MTETFQDQLGAERAIIDRANAQILDALAERNGAVERVATIKIAQGLPAFQPGRMEQMLQDIRSEALARGIDPEAAAVLFALIHDQSVERQIALGVDAGEYRS